MATEKFLAKCKKFYDEADTDCKPGLTGFELMKMIKKIYPGYEGEPADIVEMLAAIDTDKDSVITWDEFESEMKKRNHKSVTERELRDVFKSVDNDGTGKLSREEVKKWTQELDRNFDEEQIDQIMDQADPNGDGVDINEFLSIWNSS